MATGSSKRIADLIDRLEVKTEAELVTPEYLSGLQQRLNDMSAPAGDTDPKYYQYALELQALIYGAQGNDEESLKCVAAAVEQAGSPKKLRSRLLKTYVRQNPSIVSEHAADEPSDLGNLSAPPVPTGPGDLGLLSEREQAYMRKRGLEGTPEIEFLVRDPAAFTVLSIVSYNLYSSYWFYKNWQAIRNATGRDISPFWRTVFYIFYMWPLFKTMILLAKSRGFKKRYSGGWLAIGYLIAPVAAMPILLLSNYRLLAALTDLLIICIYTVVLLLAQQAAAFALAKQSKRTTRPRPVNYVEYIFVAAGLLFTAVFGLGHVLFGEHPYRSELQQIRISNAKQQLVLTADEYSTCTSYINQNRAKVKPSDKAGVQTYKDSVKQCIEIGQLHKAALQKYNALLQEK